MEFSKVQLRTLIDEHIRDFDHRIHSMIYITNLIERLNQDFRRVLRMRSSMRGEQSVITLIGKVTMDKQA